MTNSNILIYQSEDGQTKIQTRLEDETVWLTIEQMSELFQKARSTINEHILNIYDEGEVEKESSLRKIGNSDFSTKPTNFYNLDMIISVGYRVKSLQGTKFRQWATARLKEYVVKGFTMNDELLKELGGGSYFEELLSRIRDIRSSEKVFWRKVLDIYATSIDYDAKAETSILFFQTIQNKMHWAAHGHTAAEIVYERADSSKENMGILSFKGQKPLKKEIAIAKNYLNEDELNILNRMVTAYLEVAEIQAMSQRPMYMRDWVERIDDFLKMTGKDILTHAGTVSHTQLTKDELSNIEQDFINTLEITTKKLK